MRAEAAEPPIPRWILKAALALVLFAGAAVAVGRLTGAGVALTPEAAPAEIRELRFDARPDALAITDARTGAPVAELAPGEDGFVKGVLRGLSRGRAVSRTEGPEVYALTRWDDGRLSLTDTVSGASFDLNSFGDDNLAAFARLLASQEKAR